MKYWIFTFLFSFISFAQDVYEVTARQAVSVIIDGKEEYLNVGDKFELGTVNGWKRNLKILKTSNTKITTRNVIIGNNRFLQIQNDYIEKFSTVKSKKRTFRVTAPIEIVLPSEQKIILTVDDRIAVGEIDGWKREVTVLGNNILNKQEGFIGKEIFNKYTSDAVLVEETENIKSDFYSDIDRIVSGIVGIESDLEDVDNSVDLEFAGTCPERNKYYKISRTISIISEPGKVTDIPGESIIRAIESKSGKCYISVIELPKDSIFNLNDFPKVALSYASNFPNDNLEEIDFESRVKLEKGININVTPGIKLKAIGRRTGKIYTLDSNDRLSILGTHSNGDYIVKKNSQIYEYRINRDTLDELNIIGGIEIDYNATALDLVKKDSFNELLPQNENNLCDNEKDEIEEYSSNDNWEECRSEDVRTRKGVVKANNYLESLLNLKDYDPDIDLKNAQVRKYASCISKSMRHGTDLNAISSCRKDDRGDVINDIQRVVKTNSKGKKYKSIKDVRPRACASRKASTKLARKYLDVAKCLELSPKEMFPIINHESHFQPTTMSSTYALGAGQIVYEQYIDFYLTFNKMKELITDKSPLADSSDKYLSQSGFDHLLGAEKKIIAPYTAFMLSELKNKVRGNQVECEGLRQMYNRPYLTGKNPSLEKYISQDSARVCSPKNPDEAFFMSMIYYKYSKKIGKFEMSQLDPSLNENKKNEFSKILAQWIFNGGRRGIISVLKSFNRDLKNGKVKKLTFKGVELNENLKIRNLGSLSSDEFKLYLSHYLKYRYASKDVNRRLQVAKYITGTGGSGGIDGDMKVVDREEVCGEL